MPHKYYLTDERCGKGNKTPISIKTTTKARKTNLGAQKVADRIGNFPLKTRVRVPQRYGHGNRLISCVTHYDFHEKPATKKFSRIFQTGGQFHGKFPAENHAARPVAVRRREVRNFARFPHRDVTKRMQRTRKGRFSTQIQLLSRFTSN